MLMTLNRLTPLAAISLFTLFAYSCKKKDNCKGGTGGNLTIVAFPQHHGKTIQNLPAYLDTVYIKYNAQDSPGADLSSYDDYFVGEAGEDHVHLTGLKCGSYYIFATGYDSSIGKRVFGGIPYSTDKTDGEIDLDIPVTEGD
jgi:hypothetical protein